ncbi:hypothetical protein, partial [Nocardiopsis listeri]|uniref:hypothetical protein n=1 Tax=Nocardiopsis listeri TaxID=53440 RepID=UPI0012ED62C2
MHADSPLSDHRADWFSRVSTGFLHPFADHPAMDVDGFRTDLGNIDLLRGILVSRVGCRLLTGENTASVVEWVRDREVFLAPSPDGSVLARLVHDIASHMGGHGLWSGPDPWALGVRIWDPEGLSEALTQYWASQRGKVVPSSRLRRELIGCWGVEEAHRLDEWCRARTDGLPYLVDRTGLRSNDGATIALARRCLEHPVMETLVEQWEAGFFWNRDEVVHLFRIGAALQKSWPARELFNEPEEVTGVPSGETEKVHWATVDALLNHGDDHYRLLRTLSAYEISLLDELDQDQLFINGCLDVFVSNPGWSIRSDPFDTAETSPGSWGPIPWWVIVLDNDHQAESAAKVLEWRTHTFLSRLPQTNAAPLVLELDAPILTSAKVETEFWFYPGHARALCELLLIASRGG